MVGWEERIWVYSPSGDVVIGRRRCDGQVYHVIFVSWLLVIVNNQWRCFDEIGQVFSCFIVSGTSPRCMLGVEVAGDEKVLVKKLL